MTHIDSFDVARFGQTERIVIVVRELSATHSLTETLDCSFLLLPQLKMDEKCFPRRIIDISGFPRLTNAIIYAGALREEKFYVMSYVNCISH